jgi:hypothetical protein
MYLFDITSYFSISLVNSVTLANQPMDRSEGVCSFLYMRETLR